MLGVELTERQKRIWHEMGDSLLATPEIRHLALQYYLEYRQSLAKSKLMPDEEAKLTNLVHIAYFISEKNQVIYDMNGNRVVGVALSINEIIKKNSNFEDFIFHMKEMLKIITIQDKQVEQEIDDCLKKFKFTMTFHHKFVSTFRKIMSRPSSPNDVSQSLLWLFFIMLKRSLPKQAQNDIIEVTCLIACTFVYYVQECIKSTNVEFQLQDSNYGGALKKESVTHVFLEYFRLKDINKYQQVLAFFRDQISQLKDKTGLDSFFSQRTIESAYKKIDCIYMKKLSETGIDERHFLKERINTVLNANRFTPFGGRRNMVNKARSANTPSQILSHRVLNYQKQQQERAHKQGEAQNQQAMQNIHKNSAALLKKLALNKTPVIRTPLIKATPMTNAMEMYNWLLEKTNYHKFDPSQISKYIKAEDKVLRLVYGLWKDICLNESDKGLQLSQKEKLCILILSAEVTFFVTNSNQNIEKVVSETKLGWFDIWSKIDCFLAYDTRMPTSIKIHLLGLDTSLISKQLWRNPQEYSDIFRQAKFRSEAVDFDRLYRRVIHEIVYQTFFLSKKLAIQQQTMDSIFLLCQYALAEHTPLLFHRNIYSIILCSFYAVSRAHEIDRSFYAIINAFQELNGLGKDEYHELIEEIYMEGRPATDIINFYNEQFVKKTKPFLVQLKRESNSAIVSTRKNLLNSPVKDLLPKNIVALGDRTNKTPLQTPMTLALQAYHESPLLKERKIKNLANCIDGRRILEKKPEYSKEQNLKQTAMLINQKWAKSRSPEAKLNTTVKKGSQNL